MRHTAESAFAAAVLLLPTGCTNADTFLPPTDQICTDGGAKPCWYEPSEDCYALLPIEDEPGLPLSWSGACSSGLAQGSGRFSYGYGSDGHSAAEGRHLDGLRYGYWVLREETPPEQPGAMEVATLSEGHYLEGKPHGL